MSTLNKVQLIGHVGKDPEVQYLPSGTTVAKFSLATTEKRRDEGERTEWHNLVVFGKLAEICQEYIHKGSFIYAEGSLRTSKWEKEGKNYSRTEIIANNVQFLDKKKNENSESTDHQDDVPF